MADPATHTAPTETTLPVAPGESFIDLAAYREAKYGSEEPAKEPPVAEPVNPPAPADEDLDPDTAAEIDKIAPPQQNETPQQKAARTRDYRERARKGMVSRIANERDAARAEIARLRSQIEAAAKPAASPAGATPAASSAAPAPSVPLDPRDPEPTYDSFIAANPNHADPYAGYLRAQAAWDRRQEARLAAQQSQQASTTAAVQHATQTYRARVEEVRQAHPNYYDVVDPFVAAAKNHPYSSAITQAVLADPQHGPLVLYRLASDRDAARTVYTQPTVAAALVQLGILQAAVSATAAPQAQTPEKAQLPPEPVNPVGGSALPSAGDPTASIAAWRKYKAAAFGGRRS